MERMNGYAFFSSHFLLLPDIGYIQDMRNCDYSDEVEAGALFKSFFEERKDVSDEELLEEINTERTHLFRGLTKDGPRPPYESAYTSGSQSSVVFELMKFYSKTGFAISDNVYEPADHIGIELRFMQHLCMGEDIHEDYILLQKEFYSSHLDKWGKEAAVEILKYAKSDFHSAIGTLLYDFFDEESKFLSEYALQNI